MAEVTFREATVADAEYVSARLRTSDREELIATGADPDHSVQFCVISSDKAWTACVDGEPVMVFGCTCGMLAEWGEVWALGTDVCTRHPKSMLKFGREKLAEMLEKYPRLENYCDSRYQKALNWLSRIGFKSESPAPYGPRGAMFCRISAEREV